VSRRHRREKTPRPHRRLRGKAYGFSFGKPSLSSTSTSSDPHASRGLPFSDWPLPLSVLDAGFAATSRHVGAVARLFQVIVAPFDSSHRVAAALIDRIGRGWA
jgi:hypothetical protein